jgi:acetoin:2,6-dichlorophenolindophenol oxidoreductase subunit beta
LILEETAVSIITVNQALAAAIREEMMRDSRVLILGEAAGSRYRDLQNDFGRDRVRNTPPAQALIAGTVVGAAASGLRPIVDFHFGPFSMAALINQTAQLRCMSGKRFDFPIVVLASIGESRPHDARQSHSIEAMFAHVPDLKIVIPGTVSDAKALLKASIRDNGPVLFLNDATLTCNATEVTDAESLLPMGKAAVVRKGADVTLMSYGRCVNHCLQAADQLAAHGLHAEVIDLRTLKPLDESTLLRSVHKTGRLVIVHPSNRLCMIGAEIAATVSEKAFDALTAPIIRLTGSHTSSSASRSDQASTPQPGTIREAALRLIEQAAAA